MDNEKFWKILEPIHPQAERFCRSIAGNRENGDDLYQEVLLIALRKFETLKDTAAFKSWLYRIVINRFKNRYRKIKRLESIDINSKSSDMSMFFDPRNIYDSRRWLNRAMAVLSADERALVVLFEIDGWSVKELSSMFKKPEGTIKARLSRTRHKMRQQLEKYMLLYENKNEAGKNKGTLAGGNYALQRSDISDK